MAVPDTCPKCGEPFHTYLTPEGFYARVLPGLYDSYEAVHEYEGRIYLHGPG